VDPGRAVGRNSYNRHLGHVDVKLPIASHPWGKTRVGLLGYYGFLLALCHKQFLTSYESDNQVGESVTKLFAETVAEALAILVVLSQIPGEGTAFEIDGIIVTTYWADILRSPELKVTFKTDMKSLYGMADFADFDHQRD